MKPFGIRYFSSTVRHLNRPDLMLILPGKRAMQRLLFDNDSRLRYNKTIEILKSIYTNIDAPNQISLPSYTKSKDLMLCKTLLSSIRKITNSINKNLVDIENELIEQAAELGDNDAITLLAFKTIKDPESSKEDYKTANGLIKDLTDLKHPLVFKLAGDLAFEKNYFDQAAQYWLDFLNLESDTILASHVYSNLGIYYYSYHKPKPNLHMAKNYLEKSIKFGELDSNIIRSHFYLGQLYSITDPLLARYHLEISASKGLTESFQTLGFLELNVFQNYSKSLEWFRLGVEANNDITCLIGQFDCHFKLKNYKKAFEILTNLNDTLIKINNQKNVPDKYKDLITSSKSLLSKFFNTRSDDIKLVSQNFA